MNGVGIPSVPGSNAAIAAGPDQAVRKQDHIPVAPEAHVAGTESRAGVYPAYIGECLAKTFAAFGVSAAMAPGVGAPASILFASQAFAALRQLKPSTNIEPQASVGDQRIARVAGFLPFVATFAAQGYLTTLAGDPKSAIGKLAHGSDARLRTFCNRLPGAVGRALGKYPLNFVVARNLAQLGGSGAGAVIADLYLRHATGGVRSYSKSDGKDSPPFSAAPFAISAGLFALPAMLAKHSASLGKRLGPVGAPAFMATALIISAIATDDIIQSMRRDASSPDSFASPVQRLPGVEVQQESPMAPAAATALAEVGAQPSPADPAVTPAQQQPNPS